MKYIENNFVKWQKDCISNIIDKKYVILSSPTGSGKTKCYEYWALQKKERPIFITSPVKSLSNQRFRELTSKGYKVGLETGDVHFIPSNDVDIICCTQEIYNSKYRDYPDHTLVIDEFSYIFDDNKRARVYIDSLKYSKASNILICSATFGNTKGIKKYIDKITNKDFFLYENNERLTELEYKDEIKREDIKNSLVVAYSVRECRLIALKLFKDRCKNINSNSSLYIEEIQSLAKKYNINNQELMELATKGVVYYYGRLLPKEKLFIEELFEKRLIDTVVGTDALALGVNFPIENVIFADFYKINNNKEKTLISKNLFIQLSGRAGRKQYFNKGYVYWCSLLEHIKKENLQTNFKKLLTTPQEDFNIDLRANIKDILTNKTTIDEEAKFITTNSTTNKDYDAERKKIQQTIDFITNLDVTSFTFKKIYNIDISGGFYKAIDNLDDKRKNKLITLSEELFKIQTTFEENIKDVYFEEFNPIENCQLFIDILLETSIYTMIKRYCRAADNANEIDIRKLLQLRKYLYSLPFKYIEKYELSDLDNIIDKIDPMILHPYQDTFNNREDSCLSIMEILKDYKSILKGTNSILENSKRVNKKTNLKENKKNNNKEDTKMKKKDKNEIPCPDNFDIIQIKGRKYIKVMLDKNKILVCDYFKNGRLNLHYIPLDTIYIPVGRINSTTFKSMWPRINFYSIGRTLVNTISTNSLDEFYSSYRKRRGLK